MNELVICKKAIDAKNGLLQTNNVNSAPKTCVIKYRKLGIFTLNTQIQENIKFHNIYYSLIPTFCHTKNNFEDFFDQPHKKLCPINK